MNRKIIYIVSGAILGGTAIYLTVDYFRQKNIAASITDQLSGNNPPSTGGSTSTSKSSAPATLPDSKFPLQIGSTGKQVQQLQMALNRKYGSSLVTDGKFGDATAQVLCSNYYTLCFGNTQARLYTIGQNDFDKIVNS